MWAKYIGPKPILPRNFFPLYSNHQYTHRGGAGLTQTKAYIFDLIFWLSLSLFSGEYLFSFLSSINRATATGCQDLLSAQPMDKQTARR